LQGPAARNAKVNCRPEGANAGGVSAAQLEGNKLSFVRVDSEAIPKQPICDRVEAVSAFLEDRLVVRASGDNGTIINIHGE